MLFIEKWIGVYGTGIHGVYGTGIHGVNGTGIHGVYGTGIHGVNGTGIHEVWERVSMKEKLIWKLILHKRR